MYTLLTWAVVYLFGFVLFFIRQCIILWDWIAISCSMYWCNALYCFALFHLNISRIDVPTSWKRFNVSETAHTHTHKPRKQTDTLTTIAFRHEFGLVSVTWRRWNVPAIYMCLIRNDIAIGFKYTITWYNFDIYKLYCYLFALICQICVLNTKHVFWTCINFIASCN